MPLTKVASSMLASGAAGSGGSTGKNYISSYNNGSCNGDFESGSISGWSVCSVSSITNGLPSGAPTIISSPTASDPALTLLSSGQLAGQYSLQAVFPTTSLREGFISDIFTIDSEDQAKVLTFKFYYNVTSGAANGNFSGTSANTFIVAVYAVNGTNAGWVQPAGLYSMTQSSGGSGIATGTFQTYSDTTQYRFAILCAVAPTPASITITFDDFSVGPLTAPIGAPVTDWQSYTPTLQGIVASAQTFWWRRVGDSVQIKGRLTASSSSAVEARISLPLGLTSSDSTKINSTLEVVGTGEYSSSSTTFFGGYSVLIEPSVTYMTFGAEASTLAPLTKINGNQLITASASFSMFAQVPIQGWSSNVQMSNDTDTRVVAARIGGAPANTSANGIIIFPTVLQDTHGAYNTTTGQYKIPVSGFYQVTAYINAAFPNGALYASLDTVQQVPSMGYVFNSVGSGSGTTTVYANAGQLLDVRFSQGCTGFSATVNGLTINRISGPSVIAATETVAAKYSGSVSATVSTTAPIQWNTKQYDTHNAVTTGANWRFTAPISGIYRVSSTTYTSSGAVALIVAKNGSSTPSAISDINTTQTLSGTTTISLLAGEYIDVRTRTGSATVIAFTEANICIERIGNYA